MSSWTIL
jgi:hypothetical protein